VQGLVHRARLVGRRRGPVRDAQGAYVTEPTASAWFDARVMRRGSVAPKTRRRPGAGSDARVVAGFEVLADTIDDDGHDVVLTASSRLETDCPVLGSPTLELSGEPEPLNDGTNLIGWLAYADLPKDAG
jgi:hypothetical protein